MEFVKDSHAEIFVTRRIEGFFLNLFILAKRSYYQEFIGQFDETLADSKSEREEDEIVEDEEISICDSTGSLSEKVTIEMSKLKSNKFELLSRFLPAAPSESNIARMLYPFTSNAAAQLIEWGQPDSDLWDSVIITDFADKLSMCAMRESNSFQNLSEANMKNKIDRSLTFLLEDYVPKKMKKRKNTPF